MSFFSKLFSKQASGKSKNDDSDRENISRTRSDNNQNNNDISRYSLDYLLVLSAYQSHNKDTKNWDINEIKKYDLKDSNNNKISLTDTTDTQKDHIFEKYRSSIWGCGAAYENEERNSFNDQVRLLIFGTKEELKSNAGYKEKFWYFYTIGMMKNRMERANKRMLLQINGMEPEEYLKQFTEKEVIFGGKLNMVSDKTTVMFIGPRSFDLYPTYSEFVKNIFEGFPLRILGIFKIEDH